jgi:hypothetical protein
MSVMSVTRDATPAAWPAPRLRAAPVTHASPTLTRPRCAWVVRGSVASWRAGGAGAAGALSADDLRAALRAAEDEADVAAAATAEKVRVCAYVWSCVCV